MSARKANPELSDELYCVRCGKPLADGEAYYCADCAASVRVMVEAAIASEENE